MRLIMRPIVHDWHRCQRRGGLQRDWRSSLQSQSKCEPADMVVSDIELHSAKSSAEEDSLYHLKPVLTAHEEERREIDGSDGRMVRNNGRYKCT